MTNTDWPTEQAATVAVDAAARAYYAEAVKQQQEAFPSAAEHLSDWEELSPVDQRNIKDFVLIPVYAALQALPDPRHDAWLEGNEAGRSDATFDSIGFGTDYKYHENPYPSGL